MSNATPPLTLMARWQRTTPAERWHALQASLAAHTTSDASHWAGRCCLSCAWRALPVGASRTPRGTA